jgi:hypothetical protein
MTRVAAGCARQGDLPCLLPHFEHATVADAMHPAGRGASTR